VQETLRHTVPPDTGAITAVLGLLWLPETFGEFLPM
jgi:hypothetical protein